MRPILKTTTPLVLLITVCLLTVIQTSTAQQPDYHQIKTEAERLYREGSYALAHDAYKKVDTSTLSPIEKRWVEFRLADTTWRSQAATQTSDSTKYEQAQKQLEELIKASEKEEGRDIVWAEARESLGDFFWLRSNNVNWGAAWPNYQQALDWWAGQRDLNTARQRYLNIVFKGANPKHANQYYYYTYFGNYLPLDVLENALKISETDDQKTHLHFLMAMTMRYVAGDWDTRQRVPEEFDAALKAHKGVDWYDDALFNYADWMNGTGIIRQNEDGQWIQEPDHVKALELYRRLVTEFGKGETRYYDQAQEQIRNLTQPTLSVNVSNVFLPNAELQFTLNARNLKHVDFSVYRIDLTRDVRFIASEEEDDGESEDGSPNWLKRVSFAGRTPVKVWSEDLKDNGDHRITSKELRIESTLPLGAYVIEGKSGATSARDLLLVSDASLVLKSSGRQALVYFCNALTGAPLPSANITLWESYYDRDKWRWRRLRQVSNNDGLAIFQLKGEAGYRNLFATAGINDVQSFSAGYSYGVRGPEQPWRIYAFTDRPAYRPKETVQWKFVARRLANGLYSTPANQTVAYQINDPRGTKVTEGNATLNGFGSSWGRLELGEQLPLGEYTIQFWDQNRQNHIGSATLFRLEEYKLPEFKVAVKTPEENGKKKSFRLGEKVAVDIKADYYFGGPVSNANVEVVVYQNPFYHFWFPYREYSWYYDDIALQRNYYGSPGQVVKRETLKTDATGKATLAFDTPRENYNQDFEYRIEARVTDSSRREIIATDSVRVTRQRYYVYARPKQNIYRPRDKATVEIKALDANNQPVVTAGVVNIFRDYWYEVWIDPNGREVKGEELRLLREKSKTFPPVVKGQLPWRLKSRGYQHDQITTVNLQTDSEGTAELNFTPEREGYYRLEWQSSQADTKSKRVLPLIKTQAYVFVATNSTTDLGYRHDGVQIIVDKDTFRAGQTSPVILTVPTNNRYVLFSVEGDDLYSYQLVHVTGTAKMIELPIEERHVPNIYLNAAMVSDAALSVDAKQIVVPPTKQFLTVEVKSDREQYQPREEGTLSITTKDVNGKPVEAEIALGLVDQAVNYIQTDYAGDPRQFYYGDKRAQTVQTQSTFQQKRFAFVSDRERNLREELSRGSAGLGRFDGAGKASAVGGALNEAIAMDSISEYSAKTLPLSKRVYDRDTHAVQTAQAAPFPVAEQPAVQVRSDFRSTVLWQPDVKTDASGSAIVKVKYPDSLTTWQATARVATAGNQFGIGNSSTRTKQPLIVRLEAPRFFVVGDQVTVSAVINNNTDQTMAVNPALTAEGLTVTGRMSEGKKVGDQTPVEVKPNSEARVDWTVAVTHASEAKVKVEGRGANYSDGMEKTFLIYEHGIEKFVSRSGKMRGDSVAISLDIPKERKADSTTLSVQVAPSMATTMLDALPYLIDYPYGCTEQTMSRFLPAAITVKTLRDLGLKPETAMNKVFGGIEQTTAAATHPKGKHDLRELEEITRQSLDRLYNFQHADGGWGWWKEGESDHFMSAYVVWGMTLASEAGIQVRQDVLERGRNFLDAELVEAETSYDLQAWMLHALASYHSSSKKAEISKFQAVAFENLWANRDRLNAYTRALLALSAHKYGYDDRARTLVQNLQNGVTIDTKPDVSIVQSGARGSDPSVLGTAHWGEDGIYWRWSDGGVEATSFVLRALLAIDPQNKLIEPTTNWLIKNRRGAQWNNTRDTAMVVLTLNDYLRVSGEIQTASGYELIVNGSTIASKDITAEDALSAPTRFDIPRELVRDSGNQVILRRKNGIGPLYFSAQARFFSLEEPLTPAGNEIFVRRQYFKLVNHKTLLKGYVSERVPLNDGESVASGERIETVITVEAKNSYEYLLFEDLKPAGLEAVQVRSGENLFARQIKSGSLNGVNAELMNFKAASEFTGNTRWVYSELRDRKVALFIDHLPQGVWQISYEMRAESPGRFHALPVLGQAMYVPEIRTNGQEVRINVVE
jgi:uncharacterized protein YfaS (alpha-2-macroglobulin family)